MRSFLSLVFILLLSVQDSFAQISFKPYVWIYGADAKVVCTGDVNNDGKTDVVVGYSGISQSSVSDFRVTVYLQTNMGTLSSPTHYYYPAYANGAEAMALGDLNNDQLLDVVIGYGDSIGIYYQNTNGLLNNRVSMYYGKSVSSLHCGDLNSDGLQDLVVCPWNDLNIKVYYQGGAGFTSASFAKPFGGYDEINVADLNSDGKNDVVLMTGQGTSGLYVYTQDATGSLNPYISYIPAGPVGQPLHGVAIGDLNNDGFTDVAATKGGNAPNAKIVIWHQDTTTHLLQAPIQVTALDIPEPIEIADLDCDGDNEIVAVHGGFGHFSFFTQDLAGNYGSYSMYMTPFASHYDPQGLSIGDVNGDGRKDVVVAGGSFGLSIFYNIAMPANAVVLLDTTTITTVSKDTVQQWTTQFTNLSSTISGGYTIFQTDSFKMYITESWDSVRTDSIVVKSGTLCGNNIIDTLVFSNYTYAFVQSRDTVFTGTRIDSFLTSVTTTMGTASNVYPNPVGDYLTIQVATGSTVSGIDVFDALGRRHQLPFSSDGHVTLVDCKSLPIGTYLIVVRSGAKSSVHRIRKNK